MYKIVDFIMPYNISNVVQSFTKLHILKNNSLALLQTSFTNIISNRSCLN